MTKQVRSLLKAPEITAKTMMLVPADEAHKYMGKLDSVWDYLFPVEQQRVTKSLLSAVAVRDDGIEVKINADGIESLLCELTTN